MVNTRRKFARERTSNEDREVVRYRCSGGSDKLHTHTHDPVHMKRKYIDVRSYLPYASIYSALVYALYCYIIIHFLSSPLPFLRRLVGIRTHYSSRYTRYIPDEFEYSPTRFLRAAHTHSLRRDGQPARTTHYTTVWFTLSRVRLPTTVLLLILYSACSTPIPRRI